MLKVTPTKTQWYLGANLPQNKVNPPITKHSHAKITLKFNQTHQSVAPLRQYWKKYPPEPSNTRDKIDRTNSNSVKLRQK